MEEILFYKEISIHICRMRVWNMVVNIKTGTKTNIEIIKIMAGKESITDPLSCTVGASSLTIPGGG